MTRSRKFVALALVATLWVATFGFVPRASSASPSNNDVRHSLTQLDTTAVHQATQLSAAVTDSNLVESNGLVFDTDGPDIACCKASSTVPAAVPNLSIGDHSASAYLRSHWDSLAARGPPQR